MAKAAKAPHAPDAAWGALLPAALAGTRRYSFAPQPGLTPSLGAETDADAKQLLLTAANLALVQRAGRRPPAGPAAPVPQAAPEVWPVAGPAAAAVLAQELADPQQGNLLETLLLALHTHHRRVPPHLLATLMRRLAKFQYTAHVSRLYATALGNRGAWLTGLGLADWHDADAMAGAQPATATAAQRQAYWGHLLAVARDRHVPSSLLAYGLPLESPATRDQLLWQLWGLGHTPMLPAPDRARLAELQAALPPAEWPWPRFARRDSEYELVPEPVRQRRWERAQQWLHLERPADGPPRLRLTLPAGWEPAWAPNDLPAKPNAWKCYQEDPRYYWLRETLSTFSPRRWAAHWQLPLAETVALAAPTDDDPSHTVLLAWLAISKREQDAECLRLLLALTPSPVTKPDIKWELSGLQYVLPTAEWLPYLAGWQPAPDSDAIYEWLQVCNMLAEPSRAFLEVMLPPLLALMDRLGELPDVGKSLLWYLAPVADPADGPLLEAAFRPRYAQHPNLEPQLTSTLTWLRRRHEMDAALAAVPTT